MRMHIAGSKIEVDTSGAEELVPEEVEAPLLSPLQILAIVVAAMFAFGLLLRVGIFARSYDRGAPPASLGAA